MYQEQRRWNERQARKHLVSRQEVEPGPPEPAIEWEVSNARWIFLDDFFEEREWLKRDGRMTKADVKASKKQRREKRKEAERHYSGDGWGAF